ncbi:hypothetical protein GCM10011320_38260 [Neoroseomonas lacus]|uniref:Uncharacterized protein n=1 Tax=Neoroseomonas lacus TaxID=287609 RepID=A0A917NT60_9PROT|nr:hypothetical protein GCM10011320_38260 [Neoroseomonas lacus]
MVPDKECSTPILMGAACAKDGRNAGVAKAVERPASAARRVIFLVSVIGLSPSIVLGAGLDSRRRGSAR